MKYIKFLIGYLAVSLLVTPSLAERVHLPMPDGIYTPNLNDCPKMPDPNIPFITVARDNIGEWEFGCKVTSMHWSNDNLSLHATCQHGNERPTKEALRLKLGGTVVHDSFKFEGDNVFPHDNNIFRWCMPERIKIAVGKCVRSNISWVEHRIDDRSVSFSMKGTVIKYDNGETQVSYSTIVDAHRSKEGDPVEMCLVSVPKDCPPGDDRGRMYRVKNLRSGKSWVAPDSQHMCGGA